MQLKNQELTSYRAYKQEFLQKERLDLYRRMSALEFFHARGSKIPADHREAFEETLGHARDAWFAVSCMLPVFFYGKADKHLNVFNSWVFGFGGKVKIKAPESVRTEYAHMVQAAANQNDAI